jgi:multidrug efflux system membrane fusion protein
VNAPARKSFYFRNIFSLLSFAALLMLTSCSRTGAPGASTSEASAAAVAPGSGTPGGAAPSKAGRGGRGRGEGTINVTTAPVEEKALPVIIQAVGNVEAFSTVEVRAQVTGPLLEVHFTEGQDVEKGQLLFTIDPRPFDLAVRQAEAQLAKDSGQSKTAETQRARYASLFRSGLVSQEQFDAISAQANSLQSTIATDQVQIDNARLQLQYTEIKAPIAGRTGALQVHPGSLIRTADATPMVIINQITPVRVTFSVPAINLPAIREGQTRRALPTEAFPSGNEAGPTATGSLTFVDNAVDPTTSAIRLKSTFPNRDRTLWPGEFVQVRLQVSIDPHAIVVPVTAVQNGPEGQYVYVVSANQTVAMRPIKVGRSDGTTVVITSGLRPNEIVVTDGQLRLMPGAHVSVKPSTGGPES